MAVFRIQRTKDYTIMSNYHLRDKNLSLRAKGMLSLIFSLPDDWNYSIRGFASISKEGVEAIGSVLKELEAARYIVRHRLRDTNGRITDMEYEVFETPQPEEPDTSVPHPSEPNPSEPHPGEPHPGNPDMVDSDMAEPDTGNPAQLNKDISIIQREKTDSSKNPSNQSGTDDAIRCDRAAELYDSYYSLVLDNIDYERLCEDRTLEREKIDELVSIMADAICTDKPTLRISGTEMPAKVVRSRLLKIDGEHIRYVLDRMKENTARIRNIRAYLLTALYNAPVTIESYYAALVSHDMAEDAR